MTREELTACTRRDLAARARKHRVTGWHGMRKCELVEALLPLLRSGRRRNGRRAAAKNPAQAGNRPHANSTNSIGAAAGSSRMALKPMPADADEKPAQQNRLVVDVIDSHWIHVRWTLTHQSLARVRTALGSQWHQAMPVLRVFDATIGDDASAMETWVRDIEIVSDADNWYVPVSGSSRTYRLDLGYRTRSGDFLAIVRSKRLTTPSSHSAISGQDTNNGRRRRLGTAASKQTSGHRHSSGRHRTAPLADPSRTSNAAAQEFPFEVQAELLVHGVTHPRAELSLIGEKVSIEADGTFSVRYRLPNGRQVIPAVAVTPDGSEQRTIVLAIERNTKVLEPRRLDELPL